MNTDQEYKKALDFLFNQLPMFSRTGAPAYKPGLETSLELSNFFDNPHKKFKSVHIGGTNGKGSTSHMLASVLQAQGYKTGLYTSPHLVDFRERIRIDGKMIPPKKVVDFVYNWQKGDYKRHPSFFELTMIMAFNWFAEEKVDYAIIEVGMGGRLDSTNIITPVLSVITNISHDHNQFLGETLQEIAGEKAGIIKQQVPVVIGETQDETKNIFITKALENNSTIVFADENIKNCDIVPTDQGWNYNLEGLNLTLPLKGSYQEKNLKTVLTAIDQLKKQGINIINQAIKNGLENVYENTGLLGRWTVLNRKPLTIADTGHNIAGISYNFKQLDLLLAERKGGKLRVVIGFVADKAIDKILKLLPKDATYYLTNAQIPRALPVNTLKEKFDNEGFNSKKFFNVKEAYKEAKEEASENDIIFIGGSTFIVADLFA